MEELSFLDFLKEFFLTEYTWSEALETAACLLPLGLLCFLMLLV